MIKKFNQIALLIISLASSTAFAHTGFHHNIYHPLSGLDHFLVVLVIGMLAGTTAYYLYKK
jgi:hydrogenase/urease accessory protein HupE